ncbi:MAG: hypothetical protein HY840_06960 [Bacteroidetes bacterium]|nr:hypothetical protein [Bacteroidota bacterium]
MGENVRDIFTDQLLMPGKYNYRVNTSGLINGIFFISVQSSGFSDFRKICIIK